MVHGRRDGEVDPWDGSADVTCMDFRMDSWDRWNTHRHVTFIRLYTTEVPMPFAFCFFYIVEYIFPIQLLQNLSQHGSNIRAVLSDYLLRFFFPFQL